MAKGYLVGQPKTKAGPGGGGDYSGYKRKLDYPTSDQGLRPPKSIPSKTVLTTPKGG